MRRCRWSWRAPWCTLPARRQRGRRRQERLSPAGWHGGGSAELEAAEGAEAAWAERRQGRLRRGGRRGSWGCPGGAPRRRGRRRPWRRMTTRKTTKSRRPRAGAGKSEPEESAVVVASGSSWACRGEEAGSKLDWLLSAGKAGTTQRGR